MSEIDELTSDPDVDQVIGYPDKTMVVLDADTYLRLKAERDTLRIEVQYFIDNCGWIIDDTLRDRGDYEIDGMYLKKLAAALKVVEQ